MRGQLFVTTVRLALCGVLVAALGGCAATRAGEPTTATPTGCLARAIAGTPTDGCRGVEVRFPNSQLVPQGLALAGDGTAYLSGYDWEPQPGHRECQVAHVDLRSGAVLAFADFFAGRVPAEFCRHGGGITLGPQGLWLAGAGRLWLLDPDLLGTGDEVRRIWTIDPGIRASTITTDPGADPESAELVVVHFREHGRGTALRYRYADLLDPSARALDAASGGSGVAPSRVRRVPSHVQGVAIGPGGTWLTRSTSYCGELVSPRGDRIPFLPGAEGIGFDTVGRLWAVSESGSAPYQRMGGRVDVPTLTRVELGRLDRDHPAGCW